MRRRAKWDRRPYDPLPTWSARVRAADARLRELFRDPLKVEAIEQLAAERLAGVCNRFFPAFLQDGPIWKVQAPQGLIRINAFDVSFDCSTPPFVGCGVIDLLAIALFGRSKFQAFAHLAVISDILSMVEPNPWLGRHIRCDAMDMRQAPQDLKVIIRQKAEYLMSLGVHQGIVADDLCRAYGRGYGISAFTIRGIVAEGHHAALVDEGNAYDG